MVRTIVGANWGDEGKGKVTDLLAEESDVVVRFQGGANAGHTIINEYGKFALHLLPSGVFHQNVVNVIGPGVALNIEALLSELESLTSRGVPMPKLMISDRCQVMMPYHIAFDKLEEERLGKSAFGSTKSGIAPFYSDKYAKVGIQVCQLYDEELLRKRLEIALVKKNVLLEHLYHQPPIDVNELVSYLQGLAEKIRPMVADTTHFLYQANKEGKTILLEGQLGTLRDGLALLQGLMQGFRAVRDGSGSFHDAAQFTGQRRQHLACLVAVIVNGLLAQNHQAGLLFVHQGLEQLGHGQGLQLFIGFHQDGTVGTNGHGRAQGLLALGHAAGDSDHLGDHTLFLQAHGFFDGNLVKGVHAHLDVGDVHACAVGLHADFDVVVHHALDWDQYLHGFALSEIVG